MSARTETASASAQKNRWRKKKNIGFDKGQKAPELKADYFMVDVGNIKISEDHEDNNSWEHDQRE